MNEQLVISNEQFKNKIYKIILLIAHCSLLIILSCTQNDETPTSISLEPAKALPSAILQTGAHPIWFQLTERGPVYLKSIEDAVEMCAFVPWPWAVHVRFFNERENELVMAVNRDGFMKLVPAEQGIVLYHFSGGEFWSRYSVGGFVYYQPPEQQPQPVILLYLDKRFIDTDAPLPNPRTWTFNMDSNTPFPVDIVTLDRFPVEEGWNVDTLRVADDGYWYYRITKNNPRGEIQMIRTESPFQAGIVISAEDFFNSAPKKQEINDPVLPPLPAGFFYTGLARIGDSLFASWEEQDEFNIGAAGFMLVKAP